MTSRDIRKIKNPDYADSIERMNVLRNIVVDSRDAEAVLKYADLFVEQCKEALLDKAIKNQDTTEAALEYRVASKFMDMLKHQISIGRSKEEQLKNLQKKL